jgi:hypothetical protein
MQTVDPYKTWLLDVSKLGWWWSDLPDIVLRLCLFANLHKRNKHKRSTITGRSESHQANFKTFSNHIL